MNKHRQSWNEFYSRKDEQPIDNWLIKYLPASPFADSSGFRVIDIGSGNGGNIPMLQSLNAEITACDYSEEAIRSLRERFDVHAFVFDIRERLPFAEKTFDVVLCDLSLHYFEESVTYRILNEVSRILKDGGFMYVRVNSIHDYHHGALQGNEIEPHFFEASGIRKRFFDEADIDRFFGKSFILLAKNESTTDKYGKQKHLWELVLKKTNSGWDKMRGYPECSSLSK